MLFLYIFLLSILPLSIILGDSKFRFNTTFYCHLDQYSKFAIDFKDRDKFSRDDKITEKYKREFEYGHFHEIFHGIMYGGDEIGSNEYKVVMKLKHNCFNDARFKIFYINLDEPCPEDKNCHYDIIIDLTNYVSTPWGYWVENFYLY
ncbi:unnamed protein product [Caenorhabditis angaria]|uniref:Uncharacterized protein n=1 Tax=Caenorhabditis angaria TaxID=860376 RepID=A0A9P1IGA2_9PELO|nr:unnamed protein product [Caenorhabditis angaria]